jgi:hypothetical protein
MKKIFIATIDCSVSEAIRYALAGNKIIVPEEKDGKPSLELINFSRRDAKQIYKEITDGIGVKTELVIR